MIIFKTIVIVFIVICLFGYIIETSVALQGRKIGIADVICIGLEVLSLGFMLFLTIIEMRNVK